MVMIEQKEWWRDRKYWTESHDGSLYPTKMNIEAMLQEQKKRDWEEFREIAYKHLAGHFVDLEIERAFDAFDNEIDSKIKEI